MAEPFLAVIIPAYNVDGFIAEAFYSVAAQTRPDLIVLASAGHHDLFDDLRGSTTERVMRKAPCPVLAIPEHARRNRV